MNGYLISYSIDSESGYSLSETFKILQDSSREIKRMFLEGNLLIFFKKVFPNWIRISIKSKSITIEMLFFWKFQEINDYISCGVISIIFKLNQQIYNVSTCFAAPSLEMILDDVLYIFYKKYCFDFFYMMFYHFLKQD